MDDFWWPFVVWYVPVNCLDRADLGLGLVWTATNLVVVLLFGRCVFRLLRHRFYLKVDLALAGFG